MKQPRSPFTYCCLLISLFALTHLSYAISADSLSRLEKYYGDSSLAKKYAGEIEKSITLIPHERDALNTRTVINALTQIPLLKNPQEAKGVGIVVVVDTSGSMNDPLKNGDKKIKVAQTAVTSTLNLLKEYGTNNLNELLYVSLIQFSSSTSVLLNATQAKDLKVPYLHSPLRAEGGTAIGDALLKAKNELAKMKVKTGHIILVTDGQNTAGMNPADVLIAFKHLAKRHYSDEEKKVMRQFAETPSVHMIAFDTDSRTTKIFQTYSPFLSSLRDAGNEEALLSSLNDILDEEVLIEAKDDSAPKDIE